MASTACWRGNVMKYDCIDDQLILNGLDIMTNEIPLPINGIEPKQRSDDEVSFAFFSHS